MLEAKTYQLMIKLTQPVRVSVGRHGRFLFLPGRYVYTGSAKRNLESRIARHLRKHKALRWHIDYLLDADGAEITAVKRSHQAECDLNQKTRGKILVPGFGASDCRSGCGSHLKYLGV